MRICVVEDEADLNAALVEGLSLEGYAVNGVMDGLEARDLLLAEDFDLLILDLNLPSLDGIDVLKEIRAVNKTLKIIILSARNDVSDKVKGLDLGANDYLAKPFDFEELEARIRNLARQNFVQKDAIIHFDDLIVNTNKRELTIFDQRINLTNKEYAILEYMIFNQDRVISSEEFMTHVWDMDVDLFSNVIRVHIASLRKHLKEVLNYDPIETKIGQGYRLIRKDSDENTQ